MGERNSVMDDFFLMKEGSMCKRLVFSGNIVGFLRGGCSRGGGGNWGTLRIPREDWGTLVKIREPPPLGTPPLNNPIRIEGGATEKWSNWDEGFAF